MLQAEQVLQGRYRLKQPLGTNTQRQTWQAIDEAAQPPEIVVVKFLALVGADDWQLLKLFEREAAILQQLDHPKIPVYRDYFAIEDRLHWFGLVEQYIPGKTLKALLESSRHFSEKEIRWLAIEVLEILCYLHTLSPPIYHRDIKPSNLIWGDDDRIYLVDFGGVQDKAPTLGSTFTVVGTYGYTPIEQFGGRTVPASDLYALGATLIHLLTGVCPADLPQRELHFQFNHLVSVSRPLVQWLNKLTEPDAHNRFPTAAVALDALNGRSPSTTAPITPRSTTALVPKPLDSQVKLRADDDELMIELPGAFSLPKPLAWLSLGALSLLFFLMPPFAIVAGAILLASIYQSSAWVLRCQRDQIMVYRQSSVLFDIVMNKRILPTQAIQAVLHHDLVFAAGKSSYRSRVITIRAANEELVFGRSLTLSEGDWLVSELRHWLDNCAYPR